jgi:hypothetical protein
MGRTILQHLDDFVQFISQRLLARLAKTRPDFVTDIWPVSRVPLGSMFGRGESEELNNWPGVYLSRRFVAAIRLPLPRVRPRVCSCRSLRVDRGPKPRAFSMRAMSWPSRAKTSLRSLPRGISAPNSLKMSGYAASRTLLIAASEASISRRRRPPRSTNAFESSPTGVQPSSAIRLLAKLRTIEKADEKEAQREASSFIVTSELNSHPPRTSRHSRACGCPGCCGSRRSPA